jgi:hypothetical protein
VDEGCAARYAAEWRAALLDGKRWMTVDALLVGGTTAALLSGKG